MTNSPRSIEKLLRLAKESRRFMKFSSARRAVTLTLSYGTTTAIFVSVFIFLKAILLPEALQGVLGYVFVSGLAAGIEPGTVKAHLLRVGSQEGIYRFALPWLLFGSAGKAVLISPLLIATWLLTKTSGLDTLSIILWSPAVVVIGFVTTELRAILDVNGQYASAIWLKQGSLSIGLLSLAAVMGRGLTLQSALAFSLFMRLLWVGVFLARGKQYLERTPLNSETILREGMDRRWADLVLTSVLGAVGGSLDRIIAFRYLQASEANGYYVIYELLSKFWLVSYLISPIVFAKRARYQDHARFIGAAVFGVAAFGILFVAGVAVVDAYWPNLIDYFLNGVAHTRGIGFFAGAIVLTSLSMVLIADLQGMGRTRAVTIITFLGVIVSASAFYAFTSYAGLYGLYTAWLIKGGLELAMILAFILYMRQK